MSHSKSKIWIHGIFSTKDRVPLINESFEKQLYAFLEKELNNKLECSSKIINGTKDHIHLLFLLNVNYAIKDIFHQIKGASSHWINQNNFAKNKFAWQTGYGSFSVSESKIDEVQKYIENQKEHHKNLSFVDEYKLFLKKYGLDPENH